MRWRNSWKRRKINYFGGFGWFVRFFSCVIIFRLCFDVICIGHIITRNVFFSFFNEKYVNNVNLLILICFAKLIYAFLNFCYLISFNSPKFWFIFIFRRCWAWSWRPRQRSFYVFSIRWGHIRWLIFIQYSIKVRFM